MTWLGKILTVLVLLISMVAVWLTAQGYVTRTNWKKRAEASPSPLAGNPASSGWRRSRGARRSAGRRSTVSPSVVRPGAADAVRLRPSG